MGEPIPDPPATARAPEDRLDSWKAIAAYLNRDVTTVQRWEKREGMPIHRHLHDTIGSVYASRAELDAWARSRKLRATRESENDAVSSSVTVNETAVAVANAAQDRSTSGSEPTARRRAFRTLALLTAVLLLGGGGLWIYKRRETPAAPPQRTLTRITFDEGLQNEPTWSPDGRYIAYSSDRGGKLDIWAQQVSGGNPVEITKGPGNNWQPDWSPDGKYIAYRSEDGEGSLYIAPALGGAGLERKISSFGYYPRWSPDSSQILFLTGLSSGAGSSVYVVRLDGSPPRPVQVDIPPEKWAISAAWHPDGKRISIWVSADVPSVMPVFLTAPADGGPTVRTKLSGEALMAAADVAGSGIFGWGDPDFKFAWAPSGKNPERNYRHYVPQHRLHERAPRNR